MMSPEEELKISIHNDEEQPRRCIDDFNSSSSDLEMQDSDDMPQTEAIQIEGELPFVETPENKDAASSSEATPGFTMTAKIVEKQRRNNGLEQFEGVNMMNESSYERMGVDQVQPLNSADRSKNDIK